MLNEKDIVAKFVFFFLFFLCLFVKLKNEELPLHLAAFLKDLELYKRIKEIANYEKSKNKVFQLEKLYLCIF